MKMSAFKRAFHYYTSGKYLDKDEKLQINKKYLKLIQT